MKRRSWLTLCLSAFWIALWVSSCATPPLELVHLRIGGAGMIRTALEEVNYLYQEEHPQVVIDSIYTGLGVIRAAIERKEVLDGVFLADVAPLEKWQAEGLIVPESKKELLGTDLVLIALADTPLQANNFQDLIHDRIKSVAIGDKPLGVNKYTTSLLNNLGLRQAVEAKAWKAKVDVREILMAVEQGQAEVGITFLSEAKSSDKVKVLAIAPRDAYEPIRTGVAVLKTSKNLVATQDYLNFLSSNQALQIFQKFGLYSLETKKKSPRGS